MNNGLHNRVTFKIVFWINALLFICFAYGAKTLLRTPGYGISNYFELTPESVTSNAKQYRPDARCLITLINAKISNSSLRIVFNKAVVKSPVTISLFTLQGQRILLHKMTPEAFGSSNVSTITLPMSKKPNAGIYIVSVHTADQQSFTRTVICNE